MNIKNKSMDEILKTNKKIICYGAGQALINFLNFRDFYKILDRIDFLIDKNGEKKNLKINGYTYNINSPAVLKKNDYSEYILIITSRYLIDISKEIYSQTKTPPELYFYDYIKKRARDEDYESQYLPKNLRITSESKIPKTIHYCWFGNGEKSELNQKCINSWRKYCSNYEIIEWNETNYDVKKNPYMYEAYKAKKWGFVPDYARLDIVYNHGGIYLDTDVEVIRNIDDFLYQKGFFGIDSSYMVALGLGFGSERNNEFLLELKDAYEDIQFLKEDGQLNLKASPLIQDETFEKNGFIKNGAYQIIKGMTVYPERVLSPYHYLFKELNITDQSYAIHHYEASWFDSSTRDIFNRLREERMLYNQ